MYQEGTTPWKQHGPEPLIAEFVSLIKQNRINAELLDLGCGDGWLSLRLAALGLFVSGLDSSPTAIKAAQKSSEDVGLPIDFRVGDALSLPYRDESFDAMLDRGLLHHILPDNRHLYLKNILRVLRPQSHIYLSVFSEHNPVGIGQLFSHDKVERLFTPHFIIEQQQSNPLPGRNPAHLLHFILKRKL